MRDGARGIQSVEVSGRILRALVQTCEPMMLRDLAQAADLAPAQCHAYLTSLRQVDLVYQDPRTGLYSTGPFALRLGIGWLRSSPLASAAMRELKALTAELGFLSLLAVWGEWGPTIVHINAGVAPMALNMRPGTVYSVTGTATGRVFAAFGAFPGIAEMIARDLSHPENSGVIGGLVGQQDFEESLATTRANGYAIASGSPIPGINAVAAPIYGSDGSLQFVGTLVGPSDELSVHKGSAAATSLVAMAKALSQGPGIPDLSGRATLHSANPDGQRATKTAGGL